MASWIQKIGGERAAAALAYEDGKEWNDLDADEKEMYYAKAYHKKQDKVNTNPPGK